MTTKTATRSAAYARRQALRRGGWAAAAIAAGLELPVVEAGP